MILERASAGLTQTSYDICIAGAGAAGITLALELARRKKRVLLLESGGRIEDERGARMKQADLTGLPHAGIMTGRFRVLGGTTTQWGGQIAEFDAQDFEARPWIEGSGWPFPKQDLLPFYQRVYSFLQLDPERLQDDAVWRALGVQPLMDDAIHLYFTRWLQEPNFSRSFREELERTPHLDVVLHATLVEMQTSDDGRVKSAVCALVDGNRMSFAADLFVLALGTIETNRFLLQPRADGGAQPWNSLSWLGAHYQDHLAAYCGTVQVKDWNLLVRNFENVFYQRHKYQPKMKLSRAAQEQERILNVGGTINFVPRDAETDVVMELRALLRAARQRDGLGHAFARVAGNPRMLPTLLGTAWNYQVRHRNYHAPMDTEIRLGVECEQEPQGASRIGLTQERDEAGLLKAVLHWSISAREVATAATFARYAAKYFERVGVGTVTLNPHLADGDLAFIDQMHDTFHHMGGTRMGTTSTNGVVTPDLQLFGTSNTYVLSASVFPTSSYSNPTCTLLALAFRLADHLTGSSASRL